MPNRHHSKTDACTCPKCKSENTCTDDYDFDWNCMVRKMYCEDCGWSWREYFVIAYDGFSDDTGEYDSNGVSCDEPLESL